MTIKEARTQAGWSQAALAAYLDIPKRTIENWESGVRIAPEYVEKLVVNEILRRSAPAAPTFSIRNETVKRYAEICKSFSRETEDWSYLPDEKFYTTDGSFDWKESSDNAHGGIDVSWAFKLSDIEIDYAAAERLFELLMEEIQLAVSDEWEPDQLELTLEKFSL